MRSSCFDIPINNIIHNDLEFYVKSGYGGKHIKDWPFYCFIKILLYYDLCVIYNLSLLILRSFILYLFDRKPAIQF